MLIDTNVWSELTKPRPEPRVVEWLAKHLGASILSAIVLGEIQYGVELASDDRRRRELETFRDDLLHRLQDKVAPFDAAAARTWGPLRAQLKRAGRLIGERDMLIAAHALSLDVPLVTRDGDDMERTGATVINPWTA